MDDLCCLLCGSKNEKGKQRLHSLPTAGPVRERWISFIRLHFADIWTPGRKSVTICSFHFEPSDFVIGYCTHTLKLDSIPSIMLEKQLPPQEEFPPKILEEMINKNEQADIDEVNIASGTIRAFVSGQNVDLVHILVEKAAAVKLSSLHSVQSVDNFIKLDHKKYLPKIIAVYETDISRLTEQQLQRPLAPNAHLLLLRSKRELNALREKLFRWALEAIDEDIQTSSTKKQQPMNFNKAEFLIFKATERIHGNKLKEKDAEIKRLKDVVKELNQERNKAVMYMVKHKETNKGSIVPAQSLIDKLHSQVHEAQRMEKDALASLDKLRSLVAYNKREVMIIRQANFELATKEMETQKLLVDRDAQIIQLCKTLEDFRALAEKNGEHVQENISLSKQMQARVERWLPTSGVMSKKRKILTPSPSSVVECG